ncbi:type I phosphomannose isomerase catalytic subunit [Robertkochia flava]|uniref:type I phosphomannose isomerase catalytic subunit n=1 Tax=Robertkochia flava TaxID=3447986 RepID=UPI001CC91395|nr:type I phosphomannose isomerase catalytic subunit [Robertkochia marina]
MKENDALYPLRFSPVLKDYLWGGTRLKEILNKKVSTETAAESWELSGVEDSISVVQEGPLKGRSLQELIDIYKEEILGVHVLKQFGEEFPVLIKFIDAEKDLSVQLHPDEQLARQRHNAHGKTEMWYVMQARNQAELIIGFREDTNKEAFRRSLDGGRVLDLLHKEKVQPGDAFFIPPGKVHAIGAGILLCEIQQTSNITYRVYDYDRRDKEGKTRELHIDLAEDAIDYSCKHDFKIAYSRESNTTNALVKSPYFKVNFLNLDQTMEIDVSRRDSFHVYVCTEGEARLIWQEESYELKMGQTLLIPACIHRYRIETTGAKILEVHL